MSRGFSKFSALRKLVIASALATASPALADDVDALPASVTFVISTGYWEEPADATLVTPETPATGTGAEETKGPQRGYFKLVAVRQPDRSARVYLQQIAATDSGPRVVSSVELEELTALKPYVTDIRPESSSGMTSQPGLFATVYLKTDPAAREAEGWTVMIDDLGELKVEKASN